MGYSLKLKVDTDYVRKDGTSAVFLLVTINRLKKRLPGVEIAWPPNRVTETELKPRMKGDPDVDVYNVVIDNAREKAGKIRKHYLIKGWHLTLDTFLREYRSNLNKEDFIEYFEKKAFTRWKDREIGDQTYANEKVVINQLREFRPTILFSDFNSKWAKEWDTHLKTKKKNDDNSRWGKHKVVMTYLNLARDIDRIDFDAPYERFVNKMVESSWGPLTLEQLKTFLECYLAWRDKPLPLLKKQMGKHQEDTREGLTMAELRVLRKFLFACNTALRISDIQDLDENLFDNGQMSITPHKTERYGTNIKAVPINDIARLILDDEIADVRESRRTSKTTVRIFGRCCDQYCNRLLKRVAKKVKFDGNLHMHVGRYTFGSLSDQAGANHTALMKQMGIRKRETLEKYIKTNKSVIGDNVQRLNQFINFKPGELPVTK